jgi:EAL domain-containing protein (putative c-di-GMP-specific phosphodiesterase class I)
VLKIDKSFLADGDDERAVPALTEAILDLAAVLDLRPVVEGIETQAQLDRLRELRCAHGQGFLFAKPMTGLEIEAYAIAEARSPRLWDAR